MAKKNLVSMVGDQLKKRAGRVHNTMEAAFLTSLIRRLNRPFENNIRREHGSRK